MISKVRRMRRKKGLTQYQLAVRTKIHVSTLSRIENGYRPGDEDLQKKLARALSCKVSELWPA
ncbi:hypothetical protein ES705_33834 [subsurface metagenome]